MAHVLDAIRARLIADTTVATAVGTAIYPVTLPQNPPDKSITLTLINEGRGHTLTGEYSPNSLVQIDCWATAYSDSVSIADAVSASLESFRGTMGSILYVSACLQRSRQTLYESDTLQNRVVLEFDVWHS